MAIKPSWNPWKQIQQTAQNVAASVQKFAWRNNPAQKPPVQASRVPAQYRPRTSQPTFTPSTGFNPNMSYTTKKYSTPSPTGWKPNQAARQGPPARQGFNSVVNAPASPPNFGYSAYDPYFSYDKNGNLQHSATMMPDNYFRQAANAVQRGAAMPDTYQAQRDRYISQYQQVGNTLPDTVMGQAQRVGDQLTDVPYKQASASVGAPYGSGGGGGGGGYGGGGYGGYGGYGGGGGGGGGYVDQPPSWWLNLVQWKGFGG